MIRFGLILASMVVATPAMAQKWVEIVDKNSETVFLLDTDSIRPDGSWRRFQISIVVDDATAYIDNVANCAERYIEARHLRLVQSGKADVTRDFAPGEERHDIDDVAGTRLLELVCR